MVPIYHDVGRCWESWEVRYLRAPTHHCYLHIATHHTSTIDMTMTAATGLLFLLTSELFIVALSMRNHAFITIQESSNTISKGKNRKLNAIFAIPETLSSLSQSLHLLGSSSASASAAGDNTFLISPQVYTAASSSALTYLSLITYFDRPRGSLTISNAESTLQIRTSRVANAGLGLFTARPLPKGTVLGTYPGVLRPANTFYNGKGRNFPQAVGYSWRFTDNKYVLDPTDCKGNIQDICLGGSSEVPFSNAIFSTLFQFWRVSTALCRINEPPLGAGGCNVSARENLETRQVVFELIQNVDAEQELFLDYGLTYDRSMYGR